MVLKICSGEWTCQPKHSACKPTLWHTSLVRSKVQIIKKGLSVQPLLICIFLHFSNSGLLPDHWETIHLLTFKLFIQTSHNFIPLNVKPKNRKKKKSGFVHFDLIEYISLKSE